MFVWNNHFYFYFLGKSRLSPKNVYNIVHKKLFSLFPPVASLIVFYQAEWYQNKRKTPGKIENKNRVYLLLSYSSQQEFNLAE